MCDLRTHTPTVHDQIDQPMLLEELASAFLIADRIIVLDGGHIVAMATTDELRRSTHPRIQQFLNRGWWLALFPGSAIALTVITANAMGDALNDFMNPRTRRRASLKRRSSPV